VVRSAVVMVLVAPHPKAVFSENRLLLEPFCQGRAGRRGVFRT